jgi:pilus assembly protein CpaC
MSNVTTLLGRSVLALLLLSGTALLPAPARAAPQAAEAAGTHVSVIVETGSGRVITLPAPVANVYVSDPKVVEVRPASPTSLFVFGVAAGRTTVAALDADGNTVRQLEVTVRTSSAPSTEAAAAIRRALPHGTARVEAQPRRLVVSGKVATPADAHAAVATAAAYAAEGQTVDNQLAVNSQIQVGLRVRIAEVSRTVTRALGVNWQAIGSFGKLGIGFATNNFVDAGLGTINRLAGAYSDNRGNSLNGLIDALANDNLIHVLAEPNLTALSGEAASFLVGGEFPVPVAQQSNTLSVEFKQYGVALSFVPTVLAENRIRLKVRPEVSQLTTQGAVSIAVNGTSSVTIPALTVRRAETTIELGSGQSFAMAGLLMDNTSQAVKALPGIGELPVLGALFRSDAFTRNETELVIIVTPYIVRPVSNPALLRTPSDTYRFPSDVERLLQLRQVGRGAAARVAQHLPGQAGFVLE